MDACADALGYGAHLQGRAQGSAAVSCAVLTSRQGADSFGLDQGCWEAIAYPFLRTFAAAWLTELAEARVSFNYWEIEEAPQSFFIQGRKRLPEDQPPFSERQGSRWQREQGAGGPWAVPFKMHAGSPWLWPDGRRFSHSFHQKKLR